MKEEKIIGFCPECLQPIYDCNANVGTNDADYGEMVYHCDDCDMDFTDIIFPEYEIGEIVKWIDPCQEYNEDDEEYQGRCNCTRVITDIISIDGDTEEDIIYELDNGTEVYGREIEPTNLSIRDEDWFDED